MLTNVARDRWAAALSGLLLLSTAACSAPMNDRSEYRENPRPIHAYRLTMQIDNAPGEFASISGFMQYDVANRECLPPPDSNPGGYTSPVPTRAIEFELTQMSETEYIGTVHTDGMTDEDYHDRGVCRWELIKAQVQLKATGVEGETLFMADLRQRELLAGQPKTIHYWKGSYPRDPETTLEEPLASGQPDRSRMASWITDDELFTITLASKEMTP